MRKTKKKGFDFRKFWKKLAIRLVNKVIELAFLFAIGYALGLHLIKY